MVNLISNAMQAMEGCTLKRIEIDCQRTDRQVCLDIRDYGPGIDPAALGRLFEPFYTTKSAGEGLGLGLSISKRIVESLGGALSAANHPEGGACFRLCLLQVDPQLSNSDSKI